MIASAAVRTVAFGDVDAGLWGVVWLPSGSDGFVAVGAPGGACSTITALVAEGSDPTADWSFAADSVTLTVVAESEPAQLRFEGTDFGGFDQLCRVRGAVTIDGGDHPVDCFGRRGRRSDPSGAESVRDLAAWFGDDEGLAVVSLRPARAAGHDADAISAALFEGGSPIGVAEPRLSTTYAQTGVPSRTSLELWLESEDPESDEALYPRRAAGEAAGRGGAVEHGGFEVRAELFRWHMRGREGTGVYQIIWPR